MDLKRCTEMYQVENLELPPPIEKEMPTLEHRGSRWELYIAGTGRGAIWTLVLPDDRRALQVRGEGEEDHRWGDWIPDRKALIPDDSSTRGALDLEGNDTAK